ncbi:hypothetical protein B7494_g1014 [Chlorociboria aeruginascens]|nr:hypothetical protein B7494_g1014 [Chlorociboria aeruginascens]
MDDILPKLLSFPPHPPPLNPISDQRYDEEIKRHIEAVKKIPEKSLLLKTSGGESPLTVINPSLNTVPYTFILLAHIQAVNRGNKDINIEELLETCRVFLGSFDARQMRYLGHEFVTIVEATVGPNDISMALSVVPIRDAFFLLDPSGTMLTSTRSTLVRLALDLEQYDLVSEITKKPILYFPGSYNQPKPKYICDLSLPPHAYLTTNSGFTSKLKYQEILEYFYICGLVNIGARDWEAALECLENAVAFPTKDSNLSRIMVEAYKKWILLSIITTGKLRPLPRTIGVVIAKQYHILARPYEAVAVIFETASASRLKAEVDYGTKVWSDDCNSGLMICVLASYQKFQIRNLANIYSKVSVQEVNSLTQSAETGARLPTAKAAELLIQSIIEDGSLRASLSHPPKSQQSLTFLSGAEPISEVQMEKELASTTDRIRALAQEIKQADRMLSHNKDYLSWAHKMKKNPKTTSADPGVEMDWSEGDEDIMNPKGL